MIASNDNFGDLSDGYFSTVERFTEWHVVPVPENGGIKLHVSVAPHFAEIGARSVLPELRALKIHHKVCRNLQQYLLLNAGPQGGKFITIYTNGLAQTQDVVNAIDTELRWMGVTCGPVPTTRDSNHTQQETRVGLSGLIFMRPYNGGD